MSEKRVCLTPGTIYRHHWASNRMDGKGNILAIELVFPFNAQFWLNGEAALREPHKEELSAVLSKEDARKLFLYDQRSLERARISDLIHDNLEPVGADCYKLMREIDARLGTDVVESGVRWTEMTHAERSASRREP